MNVQMNVRIDEDVKRVGDEVFLELGLSPSKVVRAVWEYAAAHREAPPIVSSALGLSAAGGGGLERQIRYEGDAFARYRSQFGIGSPDKLDDLDYRELRGRALYERMGERGLS